MDVQAQRFAKQKWLPQKAKELLTLPAVSSPGDDEGKNQDGGERVVGKMTASKIKNGGQNNKRWRKDRILNSDQEGGTRTPAGGRCQETR